MNGDETPSAIEGGASDAIAASTTEAAEPEVSPIPPLFWWSLFIPAFAAMVFGMQKLLSPRVPLSTLQERLRDEE